MNKKKQMKLNNRGASIVMVLIAMTFIGILVAIILLASLLNFKMKMVDSQSKNTFYSAETAMDEIKAGLELPVSNSFTEAYVEVMQDYSTTVGEDIRVSNFQTLYATRLRDSLKDGTEVSKYNLDLLKSYVSKVKKEGDQTGVTVKAIGDKPIIATTNKGVLLKNLEVTYYEKNEFVSRIKTDILLTFPSVSFTQTTTTPNLLEYALISDNGINATSSQLITITGNVYGGNNGITLDDNSNVSVKSASMTSTNSLITSGDINVTQGSKLETDSKANLWSKNIKITSATVGLQGVSHVLNDLVVNGTNASSSVKIGGQYYGYGNPNTTLQAKYVTESTGADAEEIKKEINNNKEDYSSAILINGTNVTMDLSNLSRLMLAGNAYIGTASTQNLPAGYSNKTDIQMGESLTVKSNQLLYLVPDEYVGTGCTNGGKNPMTSEQYESLQGELKLKNAPLVSDESLRSLGASGYETMFYQYNNSTIVYVFLKFSDSDAAANYFKKRYAEDENQVADYLKVYSDGITIADDSKAIFNLYGNIMKYDKTGESVSYKENTNESMGDKSVLEARQIGMQDDYSSLCRKLVTDYQNLSSTEKKQTVFQNLVYTTGVDAVSSGNKESIEQAVGAFGTKGLAYKFDTTNTNLFGVMSIANEIVLTSKPIEGGSSIRYDKTSGDTKLTIYVGNEKDASSKKLRALVTTGKVEIEKDCEFHGVLIAKGKVTIGSGSTLTSASSDVAKVLQVEDEKAGKVRSIMMYLKDSEDYLYGVGLNGSATSDDEQQTIGKLIKYRNWKKE